MKFSISTSQMPNIKTDCLVVLYFLKGKLSASAAVVDKQTQGLLTQTLKQEQAQGKVEECYLLHQPRGLAAKRLLLVGCGDLKQLNERTYKKIINTIARALDKTAACSAHISLVDVEVQHRSREWSLQLGAEGLYAQTYCYDSFKSSVDKSKSKASKLNAVCFHIDKSKKTFTKALEIGKAMAEGTALAKDLGNAPANVCHPAYLVQQARSLAKVYRGLTCKVLDEKELKAMGAGAFVAVSQGSDQPGKLILMQYRGAGTAKQAPYVLVGKGITFDTGGISLKPSAAMDEMKYDMCGAAAVFGVMKAIAELQLPIHVLGVVAAAENMPSARATRPGDIVKTLSKQTVEILNTDAEGRLVLCDALTYIERYKPKCVIDIATLTGACIVALGHHASGLLSNHQPLADALLKAGQDTLDRAWQLPLWEEYEAQLDSPFADMSNIGGKGAGTITAASFLSKFAKSYKWAHLDIAGTAWQSKGLQKGATGRPVSLLTQYLIHQAKY